MCRLKGVSAKRFLFTLAILSEVSLSQVATEKELIQVNLGSGHLIVVAESENLVSLPLSLSAQANTPITRVQAEIHFPSQSLSFSRLSTTLQDLKLEATVEEDPEDADQSRLLVVVEAEGLDQLLHSEITVELVFKVSLYAPDGIIELPHVSEVYFAADDSRPPERVEGQPGVITIASPIIGCFFYMH